jgi:hypothetical protein
VNHQEKSIINQREAWPESWVNNAPKLQMSMGSKAPRGLIVSLPILAKGLWKLDINDMIFQDMGLDNGDNANDKPPLWLCDEQVQVGIKVLLELDRCKEEDVCLRRENEVLRVWFEEEWKVSVVGIQEAGGYVAGLSAANI